MKLMAAVIGVVVLAVLGWWQLPSALTSDPEAHRLARRADDYLVADTSNLTTRRIWAGPEADPLGGPSPDGRYLTHVDWTTGDLAVRDLAAGTSRRLTSKGTWFESEEFALFSLFSPDGRRIAYQWFNQDLFFELRVIDAEGGEPRVVYRDPDVPYVQATDWSQDGRFLVVYLARSDSANQLGLLSMADGAVRVLKTFDWRAPANARIAPDGRYVLYDFPPDEAQPDARDVFVLPTDGGAETPVVRHPASDFALGWTPDGTHVLFGSDRTGTLGLWLLPVAGGRAAGRPALVKSELWRAWPMGLTRSGAFFYGVQTGMQDVYVAALDFATGMLAAPPVRLVERFVGSNGSPDWSPDGGALAYVSRRGPLAGNQGSVLVVRSMATGEERVLGSGLNRVSRPRWSPDGRSILVSGQDRKNRSGLYRVDAQTGAVTPVVQHRAAVAFLGWAEWAPDGRAVYYQRNDFLEKLNRLLVRDLATGEEREVHRAAMPQWINRLALSPDGRMLAFGGSGSSQASMGMRLPAEQQALSVVPAGGGTPREVVAVEKAVLTLQGWTPDGLALVYVVNRDPTNLDPVPELWVAPVDNGAPRRLALTGSNLRDVRIHPDGRRVAFTVGQARAEVWVMEGFLPAPR